MTFPEKYELLDLFESEPELLDSGVDWFYNTLTFTWEAASDCLACVISPSKGELELRWSKDDAELVNFKVNAVYEISVQKKMETAEALIVTFKEAVSQCILRIQLKPRVHVSLGWD